MCNVNCTNVNLTMDYIDNLTGCYFSLDIGVLIEVTVQAILFVFGLIGNVFVLIAIATTRKLQTTTNMFICNLTVLDFISCAFLMPAHMVGTLCHAWPLGDTSCFIIGHLTWYLTCLSLFTLAVIATSRYLLVAQTVNSFSHICSSKNVIICLLLVWGSGDVIYFLPVTLMINSNHLTVAFSPEFLSCNIMVFPDSVGTISSLSLFLLLPLLLFIVVGCIWIPIQFILTFCTVRRSKRRIKPNVRAFRSPSHSPLVRVGLTKEEIRLTKILLLIYIIFISMWLPLVLNIALTMVFMVPSKGVQRHTYSVFLAGSALNPYVYTWFNPKFRSAFKQLSVKLCSLCKRRRNQVIVLT